MRSYGSYTFSGDAFLLHMEPMAAVRFKRVFERVEKVTRGSAIRLVASDENARELRWFMERYPLEPANDAARLALDGRAQRFERTMEMVAALQSPDYVPQHVELAEPARPYQLIPAAMLVETGGLLVGDDVGLGKTVEAIVALVKPGALPAIVVTRTDLPKQWQREIARFAPKLRTHVLRFGSPYKRSKTGMMTQDLAKFIEAGNPVPDVILMSYSKLAGWSDWLVQHVQPIGTVVWDEVQEFRHGFVASSGRPNLRNAAGLEIALHAKRRLGLSATPIHNNGIEIHNVLEVIAAGALGDLDEFRREWCVSDGVIKDPHVLGSYLRERGLFIRRTKADVNRELPPLNNSEQYCATDPKTIEQLKRSTRAVELARMILAGKRESAFTAAGEFDLWVRQQTGIAKAPYVAAFVNMLLESERPVVLAGWHHAVYDLWRDLLAAHKPAFFTGRERPKEKDESVRRFVSGETRLFVMSLRSGAGLDGLQYAGCSDVVFGELDWSPSVHEQYAGPVRRDGNDTPVTAWYLVAEEGSDPEIAQTLGLKRAQLDGIRDPMGGVLAGRTDRDAIKRLAVSFLQNVGQPLPDIPPATGAPASDPQSVIASIKALRSQGVRAEQPYHENQIALPWA